MDLDVNLDFSYNNEIISVQFHRSNRIGGYYIKKKTVFSDYGEYRFSNMQIHSRTLFLKVSIIITASIVLWRALL